MTDNRVRIQFELDPADGHGYQTEGIWAEPQGNGEFKICNSPFFAFGLSFDDVVKADDHDGVLRFREVLRRGGHSTYRIFLQSKQTIGDTVVQPYLSKLKQMKCGLENANDCFFAIDVPPNANIAEVYKLLEEGEAEGVWIFEEAHYAGQKD